MNRSLAPVFALLLAAAPLAAQEEPSFLDLRQEIQERLEAMERLQKAAQRDLARRLEILDQLQQGASRLAADPSAMAQDAFRQNLERARAVAEQEPAMDTSVFDVLEIVEVELDRSIPSSSMATVAARVLEAVVPLESALVSGIQRYLFHSRQLRTMAAGIEKGTSEEIELASQALQRLLALHRNALDLRPTQAP